MENKEDKKDMIELPYKQKIKSEFGEEIVIYYRYYKTGEVHYCRFLEEELADKFAKSMRCQKSDEEK